MHYLSYPTESHVHKAYLGVLHVRVNCTATLNHYVKHDRTMYENLDLLLSVFRERACTVHH